MFLAQEQVQTAVQVVAVLETLVELQHLVKAIMVAQEHSAQVALAAVVQEVLVETIVEIFLGMVEVVQATITVQP
jgi:hypothetical protein